MTSDCPPTASATWMSFVVLHHKEPSGEHYDLMIDTGETLATWRCPVAPDQMGLEGMRCVRIVDHRRAYLTYEGPLSNDRGSVTRHDEGRCERTVGSDEAWHLEVRGVHWRGRFLLHLTDPVAATWGLIRD